MSLTRREENARRFSEGEANAAGWSSAGMGRMKKPAERLGEAVRHPNREELTFPRPDECTHWEGGCKKILRRKSRRSGSYNATVRPIFRDKTPKSRTTLVRLLHPTTPAPRGSEGQLE